MEKPIITNMKMDGTEYWPQHEVIKWMEYINEISDHDRLNHEIEKQLQGKVWLLDEAQFLFSAREFSSKIARWGTNLIRFLGKKDIDFIGSCHVLESDADKILRHLLEFIAECERVDRYGNPLIMSPRIYHDKVYINVKYWYKRSGVWFFGGYETFDPEKYFSKYDTREALVMKR